ncbi:MAG: DNA polymerase [Clostridium sp.]|nr:DNA polymerase [Clostridium sp.]
MKNISIDIETFSDVDLSKCGVYKYVESSNFEILLFGYSVDGEDVQVADLANGDKIPDEILSALTDNSVIKWAFTANFERVCLSAYLKKHYSQYNFDGDYLDSSSWRCTMIWSAYLGLPLSLKGVGAVLKLDEQKMDEGKELIRYFCVPCKPAKTNGERTRNYPCHAPDKWYTFKKYNKRDVEVEMAIQQKLSRFPVPDFVWKEYQLDQKINDRGIKVDLEMVKNAIEIDEMSRCKLSEKMWKLTHIENPNSVQQMKNWLCEHGLKVDSLGKKEVSELIKTAAPKLTEVLVLHQQLAKSSVKKYQAMQNSACKDSRTRGMFQFYGANRSGRWAGRNIQLQNLPQNHIEDLEQARGLVKSGNFEALDLLYENIPDTLSQLIRTAFVPRDGMKFIVADFSAIEARVIAWLANEKWRMKAFANGEDIYCASASKMFGVPVVKHGENGHLRQKGKVAELACGYGGSVGAMKSMGGSELGLSDSELKQIVDDWRTASPNIVKLWWDVDKAVKDCVKMRIETETHGLEFTYESGFLFIWLPSGRHLAYVKPRIGENKFGGESVTYEGIGTNKKWQRLESYGPKFVENIVQAIARDLLMHSMQSLKNHAIVAHVHDEIIIECNKDLSLETVCEIMSRTPGWASGLLLRADGYECEFYKKD